MSSISTAVVQERIFDEKYLNAMPSDLQDNTFSWLNLQELAICCRASANWQKKIITFAQNNPTEVQGAALLLIRKMFFSELPIPIKSSYDGNSLMEAAHGKVVYNIPVEKYGINKFILNDTIRNKKLTFSYPFVDGIPCRVEIFKNKILVRNQHTASLIDLNESDEKESQSNKADKSEVKDRKSRSNKVNESEIKEIQAIPNRNLEFLNRDGTYVRSYFDDSTNITLGVISHPENEDDWVIKIDRQGEKGISEINIPRFQKENVIYSRFSIHDIFIINNNVTILVECGIRNEDGVRNGSDCYLDSYSLDSGKQIYRVPFAQEGLYFTSRDNAITFNEKRIAIVFSSGWLVLLDALQGTIIKSAIHFKNDHMYFSGISMNDKRLVVNTGSISIWNPIDGTFIYKLKRKGKCIDQIQLQDNLLLITSEHDIEFWDLISGKMINKKTLSNKVTHPNLYLDEQGLNFACRLGKTPLSFERGPSFGNILIWNSHEPAAQAVPTKK